MTPKPDDRSTLVDSRVADAWREASSEEPSAAVGDAILAAARREVSARPETLAVWQAREARASRRRWWPLAAAATVAAIAVGVLQLTPTDKLVNSASETATVSDAPPTAAKPPADNAAPAPAPPMSTPAPTPAPIPPTSAPTPFPASEPTPQRPQSPLKSQPQSKVEKVVPRDDMRQKADTRNAEPSRDHVPSVPPPGASPRISAMVPASPPEPYASPPPPAAATAPAAAPAAPLAKIAAGAVPDREVAAARAKERTGLPVTDWIALIRRLRAEGKTDEAAKELAAFRAAHLDHEKLLPPDLRNWRPLEK